MQYDNPHITFFVFAIGMAAIIIMVSFERLTDISARHYKASYHKLNYQAGGALLLACLLAFLFHGMIT